MESVALRPVQYLAPTLSVLLSQSQPRMLARGGEFRDISLLAQNRALDLTPDELHRILVAVLP